MLLVRLTIFIYQIFSVHWIWRWRLVIRDEWCYLTFTWLFFLRVFCCLSSWLSCARVLTFIYLLLIGLFHSFCRIIRWISIGLVCLLYRIVLARCLWVFFIAISFIFKEFCSSLMPILPLRLIAGLCSRDLALCSEDLRLMMMVICCWL